MNNDQVQNCDTLLWPPPPWQPPCKCCLTTFLFVMCRLESKFVLLFPLHFQPHYPTAPQKICFLLAEGAPLRGGRGGPLREGRVNQCHYRLLNWAKSPPSASDPNCRFPKKYGFLKLMIVNIFLKLMIVNIFCQFYIGFHCTKGERQLGKQKPHE